MCGRFNKHLTHAERSLLADTEWRDVGIVFEGFDARVAAQPRYNIAPLQDAAVLRVQGGAPEIAWLRWSLLPPWAKEPRLKFATFNARSETAAEKPVFRAAFKQRRCVVLADGFYEWTGPKGKRQPHHIRRRDGEELYLAGLWERWEREGHEPVESFTILTCPPNDFMTRLHDRMPVILEARDVAAWLDPEIQERGGLAHLMVPCGEEVLRETPVERFVGNARNEGPACLEPRRRHEPEGDLFGTG